MGAFNQSFVYSRRSLFEYSINAKYSPGSDMVSMGLLHQS